MLPPSKNITDKILREKAKKYGVSSSQVEFLLKKGDFKSVNTLIDAAYKRKLKQMEKKTKSMFQDLGKELERQSSIPQKKQILIKRQNLALQVIKDYLRKEFEKLNRRGPPLPTNRTNKVLTSAEIDAIEKKAYKRIRSMYAKTEHLPSHQSSNVSMNDSGYHTGSEDNIAQKRKTKRKSKRKSKRKTKKKTKKRSRR